MRISKKSAAGAFCLFTMFAAGFGLRDLVANKAIDLMPTAQAQEHESHKCSARILRGAYGIKFEGQKVGTGPFASVSRIVFDGIGTFTTNEIGRFNGAPVERTFTGPYTVNDDCTGSLDFSSNLSNHPHEAHGDLVIVNEGQEFFVLDNEDGWVANGVGKRQ